YLLVAKGSKANSWLSKLSSGTKVSVASSVVTDAAKPFVQAYGVGVAVVQTPGVVRSGLSCNSLGTKQPARTEIGFANGGKTMIIAIVADDPAADEHGLDEDQMSELMVQLGATQAYAFDGSGSTELLARVHPSKPLKLENYPADGQERPMPVGLAILSRPVKHK
ncbi:MAG TPA: phosphodiester glycosidase family protein, partial [Mycobacteriales bacterium]|nr:phosphodiester glycosidase family protein [Mycobacteriales bacterium]